MPAQWDIQSKYRASFERHASPEAIASALKGAQTEQRRVARVTAWLEELHAKRVDEKARGIWPYQDDPDAVRFPCGRSHVCVSCSPRPDVPGPGCINCRQTGYDQTPCVKCSEQIRVAGPVQP